MPLPDCENAYIPPAKLIEYLLKERTKGDKSRFFIRFGFSQERPEELETALLDLACTGELVDIEETQHGRKYKVQGLLRCPIERRPIVMTVWLLEEENTKFRFITAYPN
ncbi:MAG: hypothetical protein LH606_06540 [Cytophagaceae bacterium]|nr:hypothetical protein [Cytophagaceae bacterium]